MPNRIYWRMQLATKLELQRSKVFRAEDLADVFVKSPDGLISNISVPIR